MATSEYQKESLAAGATHIGQKGHGWRKCPINGQWQVYKLGSGWISETPSTELTRIYNSAPEPKEVIPEHYIQLCQSWERVKRAVTLVREHTCNENIALLGEIVASHDELMESR